MSCNVTNRSDKKKNVFGDKEPRTPHKDSRSSRNDRSSRDARESLYIPWPTDQNISPLDKPDIPK